MKLDSKGQVSAEYLFLILIFLIILSTVTVPMAANSITASQQVSVTSDSETAVSTIANAVNLVYANGPSSERTVNVYIPQSTTLTYDNINNQLDLNLTGVSYTNGTQKATVNASVPTNIPITINGNGSISNANTKWHTFTITWPVGSTITININ